MTSNSRELRTWGRCPICEVWKRTEHLKRVPKGFLVRGYRYFYVCEDCAPKLIAAKKRKEEEKGRA